MRETRFMVKCSCSPHS